MYRCYGLGAIDKLHHLLYRLGRRLSWFVSFAEVFHPINYHLNDINECGNDIESDCSQPDEKYEADNYSIRVLYVGYCFV